MTDAANHETSPIEVFFPKSNSTKPHFIIVVHEESMEEFKELVQRGANLWPDASPEIKSFADLITTGRVMQDYKAQAGNKPKPQNT